MKRCIMRTRNRFDLEIAASALRDAEIPFLTEGESVGGVRVLLGVADHTGHGKALTQDYVLSVPKAAIDAALEVLHQLPIGGVIDPSEDV